jgi:hypothetical protein
MGERPHYNVVVEPLSKEDGGGFVATVPDLPGCMSDGETEAEAILMPRMPSRAGSKPRKKITSRFRNRIIGAPRIEPARRGAIASSSPDAEPGRSSSILSGASPLYRHGAATAIGQKRRYASVAETVVNLTEIEIRRKTLTRWRAAIFLLRIPGRCVGQSRPRPH